MTKKKVVSVEGPEIPVLDEIIRVHKTKSFVGQATSLDSAVQSANDQCKAYLAETSVDVKMMTCTLGAGSARNEVMWGYVITIVVTEYSE